LRVALINPHPSEYPPLGLVTIASHLIYGGHQVELVAGTVRFKKKPDLIGIGGLTLWIHEIKHVVASLPIAIPIVVGGPCITANPKAFKSLDVDYGVVGEGEDTICELADKLEMGLAPTNILGLLTRDTPNYSPRPFMNLSEKHFPAYYLLPHLNYEAGLGVETSRGCPFNCVFCSAPYISGRTWRARSPLDVAYEARYVVDTYKPKKLYFADDNCTVNPKRWLEICSRLATLNLDVEIHVPEGIQAHHLNMETLLHMKKAGFKSITVGAESGSQRVLDEVIDKGGLQIGQVERVVRDCVKIGLRVSCFFVIGIYGETLDEMNQTLAFARHLRKLGAHSCSIRNALPVPNTRMWDLAEKNGNLLITEEQAQNHNFLHSGKHFMTSKEWSLGQVETLTKQGQEEDETHLRWKRRWSLLRKHLEKVFFL